MLKLDGRPSPIKRRKPERMPSKQALDDQRARLAGLPSDPQPYPGQKLALAKSRDRRRLDTAPQAGRETDRRAELPARSEASSGPVLRPGSECQWLTGERPNWTKCGKECQHGFDWCPEHRARVYAGGTAKAWQQVQIVSSIDRNTIGNPDKIKHTKFNKRTDAKWGIE